jgi:membrane protein YdbS with pleckstrin-like domain
MAYCIRCGSRLPPEARFCAVCGQAVSAEGAPLGPLTSAAPSPPEPPPYPALAPPADLPFLLQSGEYIFREIRPSRRLAIRLTLGGISAAIVFLVIAFVQFAVFLAGAGAIYPVALFFLFLFIVIAVGSAVYGLLASGKFRYWITNHRTVGRRGVIGYSIDSIPLETISDVVVNRTVWDRILGLATVYVQPFGGSAAGSQYRGVYGSGISGMNSFLGILPNEAPQLQQMIFHLRDLRRRETGRLI